MPASSSITPLYESSRPTLFPASSNDSLIESASSACFSTALSTSALTSERLLAYPSADPLASTAASRVDRYAPFIDPMESLSPSVAFSSFAWWSTHFTISATTSAMPATASPIAAAFAAPIATDDLPIASACFFAASADAFASAECLFNAACDAFVSAV